MGRVLPRTEYQKQEQACSFPGSGTTHEGMTWRRENYLPYWNSNSNPSVIQPVASCYTGCAILAPTYYGHWYKFVTFNFTNQKTQLPYCQKMLSDLLLLGLKIQLRSILFNKTLVSGKQETQIVMCLYNFSCYFSFLESIN
jgi:hypothetical protein